MANEKAERVARALKNLEGIDARPHIAKALQEARDAYKEGKRRAEVDGTIGLDAPITIQCMLVEDASGMWRASVLNSNIYPAQRGKPWAEDRTEKLALCEVRFALQNAMVADRYCRLDEARTIMSKAILDVTARVPFQRIVSR